MYYINVHCNFKELVCKVAEPCDVTRDCCPIFTPTNTGSTAATEKGLCHYTTTSLYYFVYHQLSTSENPVKIDPAVPEVRGTEKRNFN